MDDVRQAAADGWLYGFPLMENYRTMYAQAVDSADPRYVGFGAFRHHSEPFTPASTDVVAPNNDTPYSWAWLDLRAEPYLVTVPPTDRYYVLPFHDIDTRYVGYIGTRTTGPGAGTFLVAGPGWHGAVPDEVDGVLRADSYLVGVLGRTYLAGPDDVGGLRAVQEGYGLRPLTGRAEPEDVPEWPVWTEESLGDASFFSCLDFLLRFFPVLHQEAELRARLAKMGVAGLGTFDHETLDVDTRAAIELGISDARSRLAAAESTADTSTEWYGTRPPETDDYLTKAVGVDKALYGLPREEEWHEGWLTDSAGDLPDGSEKNYVIHFEPGRLPPAHFFWSITMYRLPEHHLVPNPVDRYSIGDRTPGLVHDTSGALTLYLQHERPTDTESPNWLPAPHGPFIAVIRLYGPDPTVLNGTWHLPALVPRP
ncbi:DUF1254 domain-containing protein [Nonomuraea sp. NPDC046570]|uniref:DUF1254 domain-containing protein n=1 Tax=Nonomuraea sp. NPDC046570 TaxID=3155255 RepID=UPI0033F9EEF6